MHLSNLTAETNCSLPLPKGSWDLSPFMPSLYHSLFLNICPHTLPALFFKPQIMMHCLMSGSQDSSLPCHDRQHRLTSITGNPIVSPYDPSLSDTLLHLRVFNKCLLRDEKMRKTHAKHKSSTTHSYLTNHWMQKIPNAFHYFCRGWSLSFALEFWTHQSPPSHWAP